MDKNHCAHCYPAPNNHFPSKMGSLVDFYLGKPLALVVNTLLPSALRQALSHQALKSLLRFSEKIRQITLTQEIERSRFNNSILVLWDEAMKRGLELYNLQFQGQSTSHFVLRWKGKRYYFESNPIYLLGKANKASLYDNKAVFKKFLQQHHFPCPRGRAFSSLKKAKAFALQLGYPLLVKPAYSSLSRHVSFNLCSEQALQDALRLAKQVHRQVMVEQFIPGDVYRALVLDDALIACVKRTPAEVVGNGKDTIERLIELKNQDPLRGDAKQKNCTLHKISLTKDLSQLLKEQNLHLRTVLPKEQKCRLARKINSGNGADLYNVTDACHPENKKLLERVHRELQLPLSALDFICEDLSKPWQEQAFGFLENNSLPYLDLHHFPSEGGAVDVAAKVWGYVLAKI